MVPVTVIIGDRDQVEHETALRAVFVRFLPPNYLDRILKGERPADLGNG
jgi:hypothetical protein